MKLFILFAVTATAMSQLSQLLQSPNELLLVNSNNQFTAKFFQEVVASNPGENVVLSAFSVLSHLAQLGLASVGESQDEILKAIYFTNDNNATKQAFSEVSTKQRRVKRIELNVTNRLYIRKGEELNDQYDAVESKDVFNADVKNIDFSQNDEAAREINNWVEDNTNHKIKDILSAKSLNASTAAVLVNTLNLKGKWLNLFDTYSNRQYDFYVSENKTVEVTMMNHKNNFEIGESMELGAQLLEIPYEGNLGYNTGGGASLIIVLPNKVDGISSLVEKLKDPSALPKAIKTMRPNTVIVDMPKFKIETTIDLGPVLQKMNIEKIFKPDEARLDSLVKGKNNLFVNAAVQKMFFDVTEQGTGFEGPAPRPKQILPNYNNPYSYPSAPRTFIMDRPFYFALKIHDTILFSGIFQKPVVRTDTK